MAAVQSAVFRTPHTFRIESDGGRWLTVTTHGDFERFVRTVGLPAPLVELPPPRGPGAAAASASMTVPAGAGPGARSGR